MHLIPKARRDDRIVEHIAAIAIAAGLIACTPVATDCSATAPAAFGSGPATWLGMCPGGRADGPGVLRASRGTGVLLFYGRMKGGRPETGVVSTAAGDFVPAWRFDATLKPLDDPSGDRQSSITTFDVAAEGARAASSQLRAAGKMASADVYARKATDLEAALE